MSPGILLDIAAVSIFIISVFFGAKKGFSRTMFSFMQWFVCIIIGFIFCNPAKKYLIAQTTLDEAVNEYILDQIETTIEESAPYQSMPHLFGQWINSGKNDFLYGTSAALTDVILTVLSFLAIVISIKIVCGLLLLLFSKEYHDGLLGFIDGFIGFLFGIMRGFLILFVLFACLVPLLSLLPSDVSMAWKTAIDQSFVAAVLYDDNLLLILLRDLFS